MAIQIETTCGSPLEIGRTTIYPISKSVTIQQPGGTGGITWHRPSSVVVRDADGTETVLLIRDATRDAQVLLLGLGVLGSLLIWLINR